MIVTGSGFREGAHSERLTKQTIFFASTILRRLGLDGAVIHCSEVNAAHPAPRFPVIHSSYTGCAGALTACLSLVAISSFLNPISSLASRLLEHQLLSAPPIIPNTSSGNLTPVPLSLLPNFSSVISGSLTTSSLEKIALKGIQVNEFVVPRHRNDERQRRKWDRLNSTYERRTPSRLGCDRDSRQKKAFGPRGEIGRRLSLHVA